MYDSLAQLHTTDWSLDDFDYYLAANIPSAPSTPCAIVSVSVCV